jgi:site-specific recombinase XerD
MRNKPETIEQLFDSYLESLALTRRPGTIGQYRSTLDGFVQFLGKQYPKVRRLSQLRRDPHILGWLATLSRFRKCTHIHQIYDLRRCLRDLADEGRYGLRDDLIVRRDFPRQDKYLPRPLSPEDDFRICDQLRKRSNLKSTALLLMRATGMRVGECLNLAVDCLSDLGDNQWAIRVPLGKMHTERWVPLDDHARSLVDSLLAFRKQAPASVQATSPFLLLWKDGERVSWKKMRTELRRAARKSGSSVPRVTSHQLRHTFATEMLRGGASLPAVKTLLGHTKIEMTLRYVQVSQVDLQREYKSARANLASLYQLPRSSMSHDQSAHPYVHALESLATAAHFIEMHRRNLDNPRQELTLRRLLNRLTKVASALKRLQRPQLTAGKK